MSWRGGLLRILVLVILCVVSRILLWLLVVVSARSVALAVTWSAVTAVARSRTVTRLGRAISSVLRRGDVGLPDFGTTPRGNVRAAGSDVVACRASPRLRVASGTLSTLSQFCHQARVLRVEPTLQHGWRGLLSSVRIPVDGTVTSHVASTSANAADDVRCEVTLFGAVILTVAYTTAVLTDLVFIVTKSTVESSQLAKLVALMVVLTFWGGSRLQQ